MTRSDVICKQRIVVFFETAPESWLGLKVYRNLRSRTTFTPRNFCLKLSHAVHPACTVNQAQLKLRYRGRVVCLIYTVQL